MGVVVVPTVQGEGDARDGGRCGRERSDNNLALVNTRSENASLDVGVARRYIMKSRYRMVTVRSLGETDETTGADSNESNTMQAVS